MTTYTVRATHKGIDGKLATFKHGDRWPSQDAAQEVLTAVLNALEDAGVPARGTVTENATGAVVLDFA